MKAAAVQLNSGANVEANIAAADEHVRAAAADGATLVVLPEKWTVMGSPEELRAGAQPLDGSAIAWARETAAELKLDLVAGSIAERRTSDPTEDPQDGPRRLGNASVHVGPDGEIKAVYRKLHMFDVEIEGKRYCESDTDEPGEEVISSELADGSNLGMAICYDLRFPELFRVLALRGARVVSLPAAFTLPTTRDNWEPLVRARAIEDQVFMVAANQVGQHSGGHHSGGCSMIVDPWGTVLAQADGETPGYIVAELDYAHQDEIRKRVPLLEHRRPKLYHRSSAQAHASRPGPNEDEANEEIRDEDKATGEART